MNARILIAIAVLAVFSVGIVGSVAIAQTISPEERAQLERELEKLQEEEEYYQSLKEQQEQQTGTIQGDINFLNTKIRKAEAAIAARNTTIKALENDIYLRTLTIHDLEEKIEREKESLAQLVRKTDELDEIPPVMALLAGESISDFYIDRDTYRTVRGAVKISLDELAEAKSSHEQAKVSLEQKQEQQQGVREELQHRRASVQETKKEKDQLLSVSQSKEEEYEELLAQRRQKIAQIRARLFEFAGGQTEAIPFEQALTLAEEASAATGVRPAFVLAILTQESRLGDNVGGCYMTDPDTGNGIHIRTGVPTDSIMKATRDVEPFLQIAQELGFDPFSMRVSCPQSIGYGGAMGPSQFIPSTWMIFKDRIGQATGNIPPNPWRARDAIFATSIYVSDLGADNGTYAWERTSACRYYSGRPCSTSSLIGRYGSNVMAIAESIQDDIDYLKEYGVSRR